MKERIIHTDPASEFYTDEGCFILELSNSPEDQAVSIARARVQPGVRTRLHRLKGIAERYLILEGRGHVEVGDLPAGEVGPGDVVWIPPGCPQRIENIGDRDLVFLAFCTPRFTPEVYEDMDPSMADAPEGSAPQPQGSSGNKRGWRPKTCLSSPPGRPRQRDRRTLPHPRYKKRDLPRIP